MDESAAHHQTSTSHQQRNGTTSLLVPPLQPYRTLLQPLVLLLPSILLVRLYVLSGVHVRTEGFVCV